MIKWVVFCNTYIEQMHPQRIRSRYILLIYPNRIPLSTLLTHITEALSIRHENNWDYAIRHMHYQTGKTETLAYISLNYRPDMYSSKLVIEYENQTYAPDVYCNSDQNLMLRTVLTFRYESELLVDLLTNLSAVELQKHTIFMLDTYNSDNYVLDTRIKDKDVLDNFVQDTKVKDITITDTDVQCPEIKNTAITDTDVQDTNIIDMCVQDTKAVNTNVRKSAKRSKKVLGDKQLSKFNNFLDSFNELVSTSTTPEDSKECDRYLRNMINYRSTYDLPTELLDQIRESQKRCLAWKKGLGI